MKNKFHDTVLYAFTCLAGFNKKQSGIIFRRSQYVNDEVRSGVVYFDAGAIYRLISSVFREEYAAVTINTKRNDRIYGE
jgi:hypothetical protein